MSPADVAILTFHRCINYGSYWQARCLVDGLRARGHRAVLLDHDARRVTLAELRCALRPTLPTPVPASDRPLYREKVRAFVDAVERLPLSPRFDLADASALATSDVCIVGSDEVWNFSHPWYGGWPLFFGEGLPGRRAVSYAASFGNHHASFGVEATYAARLADFDAISVRDDNSRELVAGATGRDPAIVLDPCLQFPPTPPDGWRGPDGPFVAVYGHNFGEPFAREVRRWATQRGCTVVSVGYRNDWADVQWITAGPDDFVRCIARARAVATNFFHGCVFALALERPFVCEPSDYRSNKVTSLMALVGGEHHVVAPDSTPETYDRILDAGPDTAAAARIHELRRASDSYLDRALG